MSNPNGSTIGVAEARRTLTDIMGGARVGDAKLVKLRGTESKRKGKGSLIVNELFGPILLRLLGNDPSEETIRMKLKNLGFDESHIDEELIGVIKRTVEGLDRIFQEV